MVHTSDLSSLPASHYDVDEGFRTIKLKFIGYLKVVDVVESIALYLTKVQQLVQEVEYLLGHSAP